MFIFRGRMVQFTTTACQTCMTAGDLSGMDTTTTRITETTRAAAIADTDEEDRTTTPIFK